ncbi:MAG: hypothetical protein DRO89_01685 [Candidatus Altiarchaeales archaeon]|nr:MAG: hypothetical protein DRO89_01685 [Candidatus Altiarchaeales archaeon]
MIILDTDFLSSFLKIDKLDLVRNFFGEDLYIPISVLKEISQTELIKKLIEKKYVKVISMKEEDVKGKAVLGRGEIECISLASENDILLMDDRKAGKIAMENNVKVVNIPGFLLSLKRSNYLSQNQLNKIIDDLKEKDCYFFTKSDEKKLRSR